MPVQPSLSRRAGGVLLHPTSLPGPRGGALGAEALRFVDFLADCGQSWWQVLPLCPPDANGSPYASPSSFAGSPALIDADLLAVEGFLKKAELGQPREKALRAAFASFRKRAAREDKADFEAFRVREAGWLADHALFLALKDANHGRPWTAWDEGLRRREPARLDEARANAPEELRYHEFAQWLFSRQWKAVRGHAAARGVGLMGDAPLYVRHDSADCWANQELFFLDEGGAPSAVAGVPPDYFCAEGQLWGNPLYRWERHQETGFAWWLARLKACAERFDALRLDHFIGLRNYWEIPAGAASAAGGRWVRAPGDEFLEAAVREVPGLALVAEDLGMLTPEVAALRDKFRLPGMRVAQFSFDGAEQDRPSSWPENCVGYTGTHDNDTARGWWEDDAASNARRAMRHALGRESELPSWDLAGLVWRSPARTALAPMQDLLNLGAEARMNRPGSAAGNWRWRMEPGALTARLGGRLALLTGACGRAPVAP
ncbi:MAG: 4-alpha-glucanotransferase [Elusimicrobia bacterium]|nr:4-alpha-glucanotransferase [Elusimicrobiota bacterium]